jgi:hypothetical protein
MSKLMLAFALICSAVIYNPTGLRDFAHRYSGELSMHLKGALYAVDRMLPGFMRFGRS